MRRLILALVVLALSPAPVAAADQLLVNNTPGSAGVRLVDTANTEVGPPVADLFSPHWSPDGTKLIQTIGQNVTVMNADGTNRKVAGTGYFGPVFSPDGKKWAGWRVAGNAIEIGIGSVDGGAVQPVPNLPSLQIRQGGTQIAWSAANELAFTYYPGPNPPPDPNAVPFAVGVIHPDGSGFRKLLDLPAPPKPQSDDAVYDMPFELVFSPDGKTLGLGRERSLGRSPTRDDPFRFQYRITTVAAQPGGVASDREVGTGIIPVGTGTRQVTGVNPVGISYAPDGERLAVVGDGGDLTKITVYRPDTGAFTPIGARTSVKVRWRPEIDDADGDALLDDWETHGIDTNGDGTVDLDLPAMGADPRHKDVFVELDYMPPHRLEDAAITRVVQSFAAAPVANPDRTIGITLHVDSGPGSVMNPRNGDLWGSRSDQDALAHVHTLGTVSGSGENWKYSWSAFDTRKTVNFAPAREPAFHYAISAHSFDNGISGIAREIPSSDFLVTLGEACAPAIAECTGTTDHQSGTFMHELGHNLGLQHGGDDDVPDKPSYLSVMNYAYQLTGLVKADLSVSFDYSQIGVAMNENALNETSGFGAPASSALGGFLFISRCPSDGSKQAWATLVAPVDFNCDGAQSPGLIAADTNFDRKLSSFSAITDWPRIVFRGGEIGALGASVPALPAETTVDEAPFAELLASKRAVDAFAAARRTPPSGAPPPVTGTPASPAPTAAVTALAVKPRAFPAARRGASVARRSGAIVSFRLSAAARVRFRIERSLAGRRRGGRCVAAKLAPRGKPCRRVKTIPQSFTIAGRAGANRFRFTGRLARRALPPAHYRLVARPLVADAKARRASFRVIR